MSYIVIRDGKRVAKLRSLDALMSLPYLVGTIYKVYPDGYKEFIAIV